MSDKIEPIRLCRVLRRNFSCLSQSDSWTQPCHVKIKYCSSNVIIFQTFYFVTNISYDQEMNFYKSVGQCQRSKV